MNLSHLKYFISLADSKHFANTAKSLSIARSTLSLAISNLESDLGAPLFPCIFRFRGYLAGCFRIRLA